MSESVSLAACACRFKFKNYTNRFMKQNQNVEIAPYVLVLTFAQKLSHFIEITRKILISVLKNSPISKPLFVAFAYGLFF